MTAATASASIAVELARITEEYQRGQDSFRPSTGGNSSDTPCLLACVAVAAILIGCGTQPADPTGSSPPDANQAPNRVGAPGAELVSGQPPADWSLIGAANAALNAASHQEGITSAVKATYLYQGTAVVGLTTDVLISTFGTPQDAQRYGYADTTSTLAGGFRSAYDNNIVQVAKVTGNISCYAVSGQSLSDPPRQYALQIIPALEELLGTIC